MANIPLGKLPIPFKLTLPNPSLNYAVVSSVKPRLEISETRKPIPGTKAGYNLDYYAVGGAIQTVKLPLEVEKTIHEIEEALKAKSTVKVNFGTTFDAHAYAMYNNSSGQLNSGITAVAQTVEIISIEKIDKNAYENIDFDI